MWDKSLRRHSRNVAPAGAEMASHKAFPARNRREAPCWLHGQAGIVCWEGFEAARTRQAWWLQTVPKPKIMLGADRQVRNENLRACWRHIAASRPLAFSREHTPPGAGARGVKLPHGHRAPQAAPAQVTAGALPVAARVIFCMGSLLLLLAAYCMGFRINTSASLPRGLYRLVENSISQRGELAAFCLRRGELHELISRRGYLPHSRQCPGGFAPLLKRAAGLPGDSYSITAAGITINGVLLAGTAQLPCDSLGRALPAPARNQGSLPPGYYLLLGEAAASFDSRYLGPIGEQQIIGRLRTIWARPDHPGPDPLAPRRACIEQEPATSSPREWVFNQQPTHLAPLRN